MEACNVVENSMVSSDIDYSILDNITIVIPTYNRPAYLRRLLGYYDSFGISINIIVADSSNDENKVLNNKICEDFININVNYIGSYDSNEYPLFKLYDTIKLVSTTYVACCGDDDFLIPSGLVASINYLIANDKFRVCHGIYLSMMYKKSNETFLCKQRYGSNSIDQRLAGDRLYYHNQSYVPTFYAVYDTIFMQTILKYTMESRLFSQYDMGDIYNVGEILPTWLTAIYSPICVLPILYSIRDDSSEREWDYVEKKGGWIDYSVICDELKFTYNHCIKIMYPFFICKSNSYEDLKSLIIFHLENESNIDVNVADKLVGRIINSRKRHVCRRIFERWINPLNFCPIKGNLKAYFNIENLRANNECLYYECVRVKKCIDEFFVIS